MSKHNWQNKIDATYVINLGERADRREEMENHFGEHEIDFSFWNAVKHSNGFKGLLLTMQSLLTECAEKKYENVLIFEDDAELLYSPHGVMEKCLEALPKNYLMFQLGYNLMNKPTKISDNIFKICSSYATHAILYSKEGIQRVLEVFSEELPYDVMLMRWIQPTGRSFGIYPMLCTQRTGFSSIENKVIDWGATMRVTYRTFTKDFA